MQAMQHPRTGILGKKKGKGTFEGTEAVEWLITNMRIKTRNEALVLCHHMLVRLLLHVYGLYIYISLFLNLSPSRSLLTHK